MTVKEFMIKILQLGISEDSELYMELSDSVVKHVNDVYVDDDGDLFVRHLN